MSDQEGPLNKHITSNLFLKCAHLGRYVKLAMKWYVGTHHKDIYKVRVRFDLLVCFLFFFLNFLLRHARKEKTFYFRKAALISLHSLL